MPLSLRVLLFISLAICLEGQTYKIETVAGGGLPVGVAATSVSLDIRGVASDSSGNLFITSAIYSGVMRVDATTGILTRVAGTGTPGFGGDNGPAVDAAVSLPSGIAVDNTGTIYFSDTNNQRVRKIQNGIITTIGGNGTLWDHSKLPADNVSATSVPMDFPLALAVDQAQNVYVNDGTFRIRKISGGIITTAVNFSNSNNSQTSACYSGPADQAPFGGGPSAMAADAAGNLYYSASCFRSCPMA